MFDAWSDVDQAEACGWIEYERSLCDRCRQNREEATDPWRVFAVEKDRVCFGCKSIAIVERGLEKEAETAKDPLYNAGRQLHIVRSHKVPNPAEM